MITASTAYDWIPAPARLAPPAVGSVHLLLVDLELVDATDCSMLAPDEIQRGARFHFPLDRQHFITSRIALRQILGTTLDLDPAALSFEAGPHGKPALGGAAAGRLEFNLSHSDGHLLLALALDQPIGVDLEAIRPDLEMEPLAAHYFPPDLLWKFKIARAEERTWAFFEAWTALEARLKSEGRGLHDELATQSMEDWHVESLRITDHFAAAVAARDSFQLHPYTWPS